MRKYQKGFVLIPLLIIIVILVSGYIVYQYFQTNKLGIPLENQQAVSREDMGYLVYFNETGKPTLIGTSEGNGDEDGKWKYYSLSPNKKWLLVDYDHDLVSKSREVQIYEVENGSLSKRTAFNIEGLTSTPSISNDGQTIIFSKGCAGEIHIKKQGVSIETISAYANWYYGAGGHEDCRAEKTSGPTKVDMSSGLSSLYYTRDNPDTGEYEYFRYLFAEKSETKVAGNDFQHRIWWKPSPTQNLLAYTANQSGNTNVYLYDESTKKTSQITNYSDNDIQDADWSSNGESLQIIRHQNDFVTLDVYSVSGIMKSSVNIAELKGFKLGVLSISSFNNGKVLVQALKDNSRNWYLVNPETGATNKLSILSNQLIAL